LYLSNHLTSKNNNCTQRLEQIVWPHVRTKIEDRLSEIKQHHHQTKGENDDKLPSNTKQNKVIIVEAALLLETNWHDLLDGLWVIQSSPSVAVQRLKENRGLTEDEAMARINAQQKRMGIGNPEDADKFRAEVQKGTVTSVITNDGTLEELKSALDAALNNPLSFKR
jgi:dephospho-CoA kinase